MTTRTMSAETAPVPGSSGEASGGTEWDSMRGSVPDGGPIDTDAGEQTDESTRYEDRGRQIFDSAKAGIKGVAGKLVRLARGGAKTVGKTAGKGASVAVGFAAIEGPKAAKATAEKASKAIVESAKKISGLAKSARERRKLRKSNREAAKTSRKLEYEKRQQARKTALGKIATRNQEIKDDSDERSTDIETRLIFHVRRAN